MKNIAIALTLGIMVSFGAVAQTGKLKGPEYKNRKPWKNPVEKTQVFTRSGETLKGPEAKNATPLERKSGKKVMIALGTEKEQLKGPEYKNRKPWVDEREDSMYAKDKKVRKADDGEGMTGSK